MAYKFQFGQAILSGNLDQEGDIVVKDLSGNTQAKVEDNGVISGSGNFSAGGTVSLLGVAQAAVDVAADSLYYFDATDGKMKRETVGAFMADIAGDALAASSNQLAVQVDDSTIETNSDALRVKDAGITEAKIATSVAGDGLTGGGGNALAVGAGSLIDVQADQVDVDLTEAAAATIADGDHLIFLDGGASGAASKGSTGDLATLLGGSGLSVASSVLSVAVSGALKVDSDKVGISGSFAGTGISFLGGVDSISGVELALSELDAGAVADGDSFAFIDADDASVTKKESIADLATLFAGAGLGAASSVISVANATNGGIGVQANDIKVDLNDLSAADVAVASDSIAIIDANDSNATKKESIADLVAAMAGAGLAASNGVLSTQAGTSTQMSSGTALSEGYNFTTGSAGGSFTLPNNPSTGDLVVIKRGQTGNVTVSTAANSQTIDGEASILLESPHAAVSLVYLVTGSWGIV